MVFARILCWVFGILFLVAAPGVVVGLVLNTIWQGPPRKEVYFLGVLMAGLLVWRGTEIASIRAAFQVTFAGNRAP